MKVYNKAFTVHFAATSLRGRSVFSANSRRTLHELKNRKYVMTFYFSLLRMPKKSFVLYGRSLIKGLQI